MELTDRNSNDKAALPGIQPVPHRLIFLAYGRSEFFIKEGAIRILWILNEQR